MKIVFEILSRKEPDQICPIHYTAMENPSIEYEGKVKYPINGVLSKKLTKDDDVKLVILRNDDDNSKKSEDVFVEEFKRVTGIEPKAIEHVVETDDENMANFRKRFLELMDNLEEDAEIYLDITYGQKTQPLIAFSMLSFAEKFYDADIKYIVYAAAVLSKGVPVEGAVHKLFDVTSLYYLNNMAHVMDAPDGKTAKSRLKKLFN